MKITILILLITIQLLIVGFLLIQIYNKKQNNILGSTSVNPVKKESIISTSSANLKYFFEPMPNSKRMDNDWTPYGKIAKLKQINSDSLNEEHDYSINKPEKTYRVIALGDSFTYGLYVDTKDNWVKQLENDLNKGLKCSNVNNFEVINLGVGGYDIQYSLERFKIRGKKYNPDLVIWFLKDDDFMQINEIMLKKEKEYQKQMRETGEFEKEVKKGNMYPSFSKALYDSFRELGEDKTLAMQKQFLEEFHQTYDKNLIFMSFPFIKKSYKEFLELFVKKYTHTFLFSQLTNIYDEYNNFFPNDKHPTQKGHELIANNLFEYLTKNKIIPCD